MITVCFWLALAILIGSLLLSMLLAARRQYGGALNPVSVLFAGILLASLVLFVPPYMLQEEGDPFQIIKTLMFSTSSAMGMFGGGGDYDLVREGIGTGSIQPFYLLLVSVLVVLAPALTLGVVVSFFGNFISAFRYALAYSRDVSVFSELNERSLVLAADMKKQNDRQVLVFTSVNVEDDKNSGLRDRAKGLGALLYTTDILEVPFEFHSPKHSLRFFVMGQDESKNVDRALGLVNRYGDRPNTHLYVLSTCSEGEALLSAAHNRTMKVRRVDEVQSLISRTLYDEGHLLFQNALPAGDGEKVISAVVVGMGKHGTAMVKSLPWFCQMDGYRVRINAFDRDALAEDKFSAQCPELMDPRYNGVYVDGEAQYYIRIHSGVDVDTKSFSDRIHSLNDATYVLVALGDDGSNIRTALRLRMLFEQCGAKPTIQAIVQSSDKRQALEGLKNYRGQAYNIEFIGDLESSYTEKVIIDSELEEEALRRHLRWGAEEDFWGYEYNYRSSVALAIHARAKARCGIPGAQKPDAELTEQERLQLEILEHRRWNAYMRSEGYIYSGSPEKSSRNDLGKMHHDLVDFDSLTEEEKRKDSRVGSA